MASLRARLLFNRVMPWLKMKQRYAPPLDAATLLARRRKACSPPREATQRAFRGRPVLRLGHGAEPTMLYLHGGAFVNPITRHHWRLITQLVRDTGGTCDVPLYPLAPEQTLDDMLAFTSAFWRDHTWPQPPVIVADSAGTLLALRLAQSLRDAGAPQPAALVLISPCLDLTFSDPRSKDRDAVDPMLALAGLPHVGRIVAGPRALDDPAINPLLCGLQDLPPMLVFSAGRDVLWPDAVRLVEGVRAAGGQVAQVDAPEMVHVWPLMPIPEAASARARMAEFVRKTVNPSFN